RAKFCLSRSGIREIRSARLFNLLGNRRSPAHIITRKPVSLHLFPSLLLCASSATPHHGDTPHLQKSGSGSPSLLYSRLSAPCLSVALTWSSLHSISTSSRRCLDRGGTVPFSRPTGSRCTSPVALFTTSLTTLASWKAMFARTP